MFGESDNTSAGMRPGTSGEDPAVEAALADLREAIRSLIAARPAPLTTGPGIPVQVDGQGNGGVGGGVRIMAAPDQVGRDRGSVAQRAVRDAVAAGLGGG